MNIKKRAELVLFLSTFFNSLVFFAPVAILVRTRWGITVSQFFILQAVLSFCIFIFEVPCGLITDKIGYRSSIVVSQILLCFTRIIFLLGGSFFLFVVEAIIESVSISFISGTINAYMYGMYGNDEYMPKLAALGNYGTAGFILSTLVFVPLNRFYNINGLIIATLISLFISLAILFFLPKTVYKKKFNIETESTETRPPLKSLIKSLCTREVTFLFLMTSFMSLAILIINFFYILKLQDNNISQGWMSFIILGYSGIEMLNPFIIKKFQKFNKGIVFAVVYFFTACMFFMLNIFSGYSVIVPMLLLPVLLSFQGFFLSSISNHLIDKLGQQKNRAGFLSVFNQGANLFEIFFLFFASAAGSKTVSLLFFIMAIGFLLCSILTALFRHSDFFKLENYEKL